MTAKSRSVLETQINVLRNEGTPGANTADRVATLLQDIVDSLVASGEGGLTVNGTAVNAIVTDPIDVSIANGTAKLLGIRPQYVYGRDAIAMLNELRSTSGKSLFIFGDSRTSNPNEWMVANWSHVPIGGLSHSLNTGMNATIYSPVVVGQVPNVYQAGPGAGWTCTCTCLQAIQQAEQTIWWNRTSYGDTGLISPASLGWPTNALICSHEFATDADGVVANSLALLVYVDAGTAAGAVKSSYFGTYSASPGRKVVSVAIPPSLPWGSAMAIQVVFSPSISTVVGQKFIECDAPWVEYADGSRTTLHSLAIGGDKIGDNLDNGINEIGYNLGPNQFPEDRLSTFIRTRSTRRPWFLIDLGTNGTVPYTSAEIHASRLRRLIAKLRRCANDQLAPVLLRTAYPGAGDGATRYNQLAAIAVSNAEHNVMCVDTYGAAAAGGGYAVAVANGWFGASPDGVHRNSSGRHAFESMFNAIVGGTAWLHSATLG